MDIKRLFEDIDKLKERGAFERSEFKKGGIKYETLPELPKTIREGLIFRHIAINLPINEKFKGKWENYWLGWCLKPQSNSFFAATAGVIDPEDDVMKILQSETFLAGLTVSGKAYYLRRVADWYLKRFNWKAAKTLLALIPREHQSFLDVAKLGYPRLFGSVVVGFLPLLSAPDLWKFPISQPACFTTALAFVSLTVAFLYLRIEYANTTGHTDSERPSGVLLAAVVCALSVSAGFTALLENHFLCKEFLSQLDFRPFQFTLGGISLYVSLWIFLASAALVIGIFVQSFWEEKTMTEPL